MKTNERFNLIRKIKLNLSDVKPNKFEPLEKDENDPCWEDYVQVGTKIVDGREVPNCVPLEASKVVKEGFPIPSPESGEEQDKYISRCMEAIGNEYDTQEQALAVCYAQLEK
jgi:hypothetical protein